MTEKEIGCGIRFNEVIYEDGSEDYEVCTKINQCPECKRRKKEND